MLNYKQYNPFSSAPKVEVPEGYYIHHIGIQASQDSVFVLAEKDNTENGLKLKVGKTGILEFDNINIDYNSLSLIESKDSNNEIIIDYLLKSKE